VNQKNFEQFHFICEVIQRTHPHQRPLLLKNPWDFANGHNIKRWIPSAKFVYIHRDPVDSINSLWLFAKRVILQPWPYLAMLSKRYERFARSKIQIGALQAVVKWCPQWFVAVLIHHTIRQCTRYMQTVELIPESERVSITYPQLCDSPDETIGQVLDRLGLAGSEVDYQAMVSPRNVTIDSVVAKQKARIHRRLAKYMATVGVEG
jgi:hypothetical protein